MCPCFWKLSSFYHLVTLQTWYLYNVSRIRMLYNRYPVIYFYVTYLSRLLFHLAVELLFYMLYSTGNMAGGMLFFSFCTFRIASNLYLQSKFKSRFFAAIPLNCEYSSSRLGIFVSFTYGDNLLSAFHKFDISFLKESSIFVHIFFIYIRCFFCLSARYSRHDWCRTVSSSMVITHSPDIYGMTGVERSLLPWCLRTLQIFSAWMV